MLKVPPAYLWLFAGTALSDTAATRQRPCHVTDPSLCLPVGMYDAVWHETRLEAAEGESRCRCCSTRFGPSC